MQNSDERLIRLEAQTQNILDKLEGIDERLFGNGQPGIIDKLSARVSHLEVKFWMALGGSIVILWIVEHLLAS